jgi:hypothetical protein
MPMIFSMEHFRLTVDGHINIKWQAFLAGVAGVFASRMDLNLKLLD